MCYPKETYMDIFVLTVFSPHVFTKLVDTVCHLFIILCDNNDYPTITKHDLWRGHCVKNSTHIVTHELQSAHVWGRDPELANGDLQLGGVCVSRLYHHSHVSLPRAVLHQFHCKQIIQYLLVILYLTGLSYYGLLKPFFHLISMCMYSQCNSSSLPVQRSQIKLF